MVKNNFCRLNSVIQTAKPVLAPTLARECLPWMDNLRKGLHSHAEASAVTCLVVSLNESMYQNQSNVIGPSYGLVTKSYVILFLGCPWPRSVL
jgi:hypothetical protein